MTGSQHIGILQVLDDGTSLYKPSRDILILFITFLGKGSSDLPIWPGAKNSCHNYAFQNSRKTHKIDLRTNMNQSRAIDAINHLIFTRSYSDWVAKEILCSPVSVCRAHFYLSSQAMMAGPFIKYDSFFPHPHTSTLVKGCQSLWRRLRWTEHIWGSVWSISSSGGSVLHSFSKLWLCL